jgi:hypothetical protein
MKKFKTLGLKQQTENLQLFKQKTSSRRRTVDKEDIIRMAREAGGADITSHGWTSWVGTQSTDFLERFAALVAAQNKAAGQEHMTDREMMIDCPRCGHCCPQPEQEPVAWRYDQAKYRTNDLRGRQWAFNVFSQTRPYIDEMVQNVTPLYTTPPAAQPFWDLFDETQRLRAELKFNTTPPQRWVGLTDDEIGVPTEPIQPNEAIMFARVIEALIKGKNT